MNFSDEFRVAKFWGAAVGLATGVWFNIPLANQVLFVLMGIDVVMGSLRAILDGSFRPRALMHGVVLKCIVVLPLLAVHQIERAAPGIGFDLDKWAATGLWGYEFVSICDTYARVTGRTFVQLSWISALIARVSAASGPPADPQKAESEKP